MVFYGFHRRDSRGPVAAGNHQTNKDGNHKKTFLATTETIQKSTTETIKLGFPATTETIKNQRRKPVLKTQQQNEESLDTF